MAELDFRDYLRSLPHPNAQDGGDLYTPTEAELPLKVQTVISRQSHDPNQQRQEQSKRFDVLDGLRTFASEHILLVGKPGSGKSTALQRLRWEEAQKALAAVENKQVNFTIPVLMELRDRRDGSVVNWIQKSLRKVTRDEAAIEDLLFAGRFLLLFDGLNELPTSDAWSALDEFQRDQDFCANPRIFTTRELAAESDLGIERKLKMLPLTEPQMRQFIENRLPGRAESLLSQLKDRLRELAETPLLLKILCDVVQDSPDGQLPQNRGELFQKEFARRYEKFKPSHTLPISGDSRRFTAELLQHLAFTMIQGDPHTDPCKPTPSWLIISKTKAEKILEDYLTGRVEAPAQNAKKWLEDLLNFKLLVVKDLDHIEFLHQLFQEYYAAEQLLTLLPTLSDRELKQDYLNYLKWTEAIAFMVGLLNNDTPVLQIVDSALKVDLMLGARLAGNAKQVLQTQTLNLIVEQKVCEKSKIAMLGKTRSEKAVSLLSDLFKSQDSLVRLDVVKALGQIGGEAAISGLIEALDDHDYSVRSGVIDGLEQIGGELMLPALIKALEDWELRGKVFLLLAEIDLGDEVEILSIGIEHIDPEIRWGIALALSKMKSEKSARILLKAIENSNFDVKFSAAFALGERGFEVAIPVLQQAIETTDSLDLHRIAIQTLIKINSERSALTIGKLIRHPNSNIGNLVIEVLWSMDLERIAPALRDIQEVREVRDEFKTYISRLLNAQDTPNKLLQATRESTLDLVRSAALLLRDARKPKMLSTLWQQQISSFQMDVAETIYVIQLRYGFYNYEIAQAAVEERKREKEGCTKSSIISNDQLYDDILTTIFNSGRNIESSPKEIRSLDEESLRHILIHAVNAKYSNVAEAEAYNKGGKTDILVRINGEKILIAECKIWHGEDGLAKALDQLLQRYVTWRDTKLALLIFSRNQKFSDVVQKISQEIKHHQYFVREENSDSEKAWFRFAVCHPDDRDRELTLTILAFDMPS